MRLDYNIENYKDRLEEVEILLEKKQLSNYELEKAANYLLFAKDVPKVKKMEYNFYTNWSLFNKALTLETTLSVTQKDLNNHYCEGSTDNVKNMISESKEEKMNFFLDLLQIKNYRVATKQEITEDDKKDEILLDYQNFIDC